MSTRRVVCTTLLVASLLAGRAFAADEHVDYLQKIKPLLAARCYACHGALKQEANLRLDTAALALKGGDSGPAIEPGNPDASHLIQRVVSNDDTERMPAVGKPLKPEEIAELRTWIEQKATVPATERPEQDPREHWSFRPIVRPTVPTVSNPVWVRNPIDAFIARKLEQSGLTPQVDAPRGVLVRRLYLDLVGVPPTEPELAELNSASGDGWYEPLVQRLLDDPRHGERWARRWMDIWRYSDWWGLGEERRYSQDNIWHWRDWIVESLNANMPYDEMVRLMLAADELRPNDPEKLRATGYLARNWSLYFRNLSLDETIENVSKGFLGLTINCVKCHDHKFDPITQVEYYQLRAIFEPCQVRQDILPGEINLAHDSLPRVFDGPLDVPTYRFERGQEGQPDKSKVIPPGVPKFLSFSEFKTQPVQLPKEAWQPERRPWVLEAYEVAAIKDVASAEAAVISIGKKLEAAEKSVPKESKSSGEASADKTAEAAVADTRVELHAALAVADTARAESLSVAKRCAAMRAAWAKNDGQAHDKSLAETEQATAVEAVKAERRAAVAKALSDIANSEFRLRHAPADQKQALETKLTASRVALEKAEKASAADVAAADSFTQLIGAKWSPVRSQSSLKDDPTIELPSQSTGRRTALAGWITDRRNPLAARVAANHIWSQHMGVPLVSTVFDFGRKGAPPTNPELLDWLAAELIDSGWDMKHLHRLIVTSAAYRMSSSEVGREDNLAKDPDDLNLWRRTPIRLDAEVVRDSILSLSGKLDLARGGPPIPAAAQTDSTRRSIYFFHSNNDRNQFLTTFDEPGVKECCRRDQSIIPQQALALSNSQLTHDAARRIAEHLSGPSETTSKQPPDDEFIGRAFEFILNIRANEDEIRACRVALEAWRKEPEVAAEHSFDRARQNLVWALFNHNDFVTLR